MAVVEVIEALHFSGNANKEQIAQRLRHASEHALPSVANAPLIALTMRQIATGLTAGNDDTAEQIRRLLH